MAESITSSTEATAGGKDQLATRPVRSSAPVVGQWKNINDSSDDNDYLNTSPVPSTKRKKNSARSKNTTKPPPTAAARDILLETAAEAPAKKKKKGNESVLQTRTKGMLLNVFVFHLFSSYALASDT